MKTTPAILYKYMPFAIANKVLAGKMLRATPPNDFNDPFEMMPKSYSGMTHDIIYSKAEEKCHSPQYYEIVKKRLNLSVSYEAFSAYLLQNPDIIEGVATDIKKSLGQRDFTSLVNQISTMLGVLCFSGDNDSILMWSHYADNHKGAVIGFDSKALAQQWFPVRYQDTRVDIPFGIPSESPEYEAAVREILATKYTTWYYENEFRCFMRLDHCIKKSIDCKDMYFSQLPTGSIKEVILGAKMPEDNRNVLRALHVGKISESKMDLKEFRVRI